MIDLNNTQYAYITKGKARAAQFLIDTGFGYGGEKNKTRVYLLVETQRVKYHTMSRLNTTCEMVMVRNDYFSGDYSIFTLGAIKSKFTGFLEFSEKFSAVRCSEDYLKGEAWRVMLLPMFAEWAKTCFEHLLAHPDLTADSSLFTGDAHELVTARNAVMAAYSEMAVRYAALDVALNAVDTLTSFNGDERPMVNTAYLLSGLKQRLSKALTPSASGHKLLIHDTAGELIAYLNALGVR